MSAADNKITMTRGDTYIAEVGITTLAGEPYTPQEGDTIRFAVKHPNMDIYRTEYTDATPLILKDIPISTMILKLEPEDTKPLGFGEYVYDIEITFANGDVDTFIKEATLELTPEVH